MKFLKKINRDYKSVGWYYKKEIEIPCDWEQSNIQKVCILRVPGVKFFDGNRTYIDTANIQNSTIHSGIDVQFNSRPTRANVQVKEDDILLAKMKDTRKILLITKNEINYIFSTGFFAIKSKNEKILPRYLLHYFNSNFFQKMKDNYCVGATQEAIGSTEFKKLLIIYPNSIQEQEKIASIFTNLHYTINSGKMILEKTKKLKKGLVENLLKKGINHNKFKHVQLPQKFLKLSIPDIWKVKSLVKISRIIDTPHYTSPESIDGIPIITTSDCKPDGTINYSETKFTFREEYEKRRQVIDPDVGDVIYTREAPFGIAVLVDRKEIAVGQRIILLKTQPEIINNSFLVYFLNSHFGFRQANALSVKTTVDRVNIMDIENYQIPIPSLEEQKKIISVISKIDDKAKKYEKWISNLETLKKGIDNQLLTGKIRVNI